MAWREVIYEYDGSFAGLMCCIYESYTHKERPVMIRCTDNSEFSLYETHTIVTNESHAHRVYDSFRRYSPKVGSFLQRAYLTCLEEKEMAVYRFVVRLYRDGRPLLRRLSDETYYPLLRAVRHLNGELEQYRGFVRFSDTGGVLTAEIEPKNRVLPLLCVHFCQRCHDETFFIYDRTHQEALFYSDGKSSILPLTAFTPAPPDEAELGYRRLWRCFYDTVAIRERENPKLRMTHMPKRYWNLLTEFQGESEPTLPVPSPRANAPVPGAPAARPAPAIPPAPAPTVPASFP